MVRVSEENRFSPKKSKICPRNDSEGPMVCTLNVVRDFIHMYIDKYNSFKTITIFKKEGGADRGNKYELPQKKTHAERERDADTETPYNM
jgi:hypothetical protein